MSKITIARWRLLLGPGFLAALLASVSFVVGCDTGDTSDPAGTGGEDDGGPDGPPLAGDDALEIGLGDFEAAGGADSGTTAVVAAQPITALPVGFVGADALGGWKVVGPLADLGVATQTECVNILRAIVRDLPESHVDFERGGSGTGVLPGMVKSDLGPDRKPVLAGLVGPDDQIESEQSLSDWYHNVPGANQPFVVDLWLQPVGNTFVFDSATFFPLSGVGYALLPGGAGQAEGFHFTTELHTSFRFQGSEVFTFRGDDDVWVFINGKLAIDLGGVHEASEQKVDLAVAAVSLGLTMGEVYPLDLFQAERQTVDSNFRIETTLDFSGCGEILETDIIEE